MGMRRIPVPQSIGVKGRRRGKNGSEGEQIPPKGTRHKLEVTDTPSVHWAGELKHEYSSEGQQKSKII